MNKLQIHLPTPIYKELRILAAILDYSMADLVRRGIEHILSFYPQHRTPTQAIKPAWTYPKPRKLGLKISDPELLKEMANNPES